MGEAAVHALRGVNLKVERGEFVAINGASGSGKSTLFHILGGLTRPTSGAALISGRDLASMTNAELTEIRKTTVGFVFQKYNLLPTLSAEDNIRIVQYIGGRGTVFDPSFREVLQLRGIADRMKHKPSALSGGQQQRVAIARAIVGRPGILLADEPTGNLDSQMGDEIMSILEDLNQKEGATIVMVTHDPRMADKTHRVVRLFDGRQVQ